MCSDAGCADFAEREGCAGRIVRSKAGHDKGWFFVIVGGERDTRNAGTAGAAGTYYFLADGRERKLAKPKRKNAKHVAFTGAGLDLTDITDRKLRRELHSYNFNAGTDKTEQTENRDKI